MKNRLMKLAGLLKEDDFELPDENPFEEDDQAIKTEVTEKFVQFENAINATPSQQYVLYSCASSRGDVEASFKEGGTKNVILKTLIQTLIETKDYMEDQSYFDEFFSVEIDNYSVEGVIMLTAVVGEEEFFNVIRKEDEKTVLEDYGYDENDEDYED